MTVIFRAGRTFAVGMALAQCWVSAVPAADRAVHMKVLPDLAKHMTAMPEILDPADAAERKINLALARLDGAARKAVADCKAQVVDSGGEADWSRSVDVTMRGPRFLSYAVVDDASCGGAHPNTGTMSIVYDLQSGTPVDWSQLLPRSFTEKLDLGIAMDGSKIVTLSSKRLFQLYRAGYRSDDADCKEAIATAGQDQPPAMMAWLDAKANGLVVQFDMAHVVQACALPVTIPVDTLVAEGAQPALIDALRAAHAALPPPK